MSSFRTGGCLCGAVRYLIDGDFDVFCYACHCTECQTQSGSAFGLQIPLPATSISITGSLRESTGKTNSGLSRSIFCCEECAVRILGTNSALPGIKTLRAGTLDQSSSLTPTTHLWTKSKQPWIRIPENSKQYAKQPKSVEEWKLLLAGK